MRTTNPERKAKMLSIRTSAEIRAKLEAASVASGRTLTQEVETRLEKSFNLDQYVGGSENSALAILIAALLGELEARTGKSWRLDCETWNLALKEVAGLLNKRRPPDADLQLRVKKIKELKIGSGH